MHRYQTLVVRLQERIERGSYAAGSKLPSIRSLAREFQLSTSTVVMALQHLEDQAWLQARPRSGFYVLSRLATRLAIPSLSQPPAEPRLVQNQQRALLLTQSSQQSGILALGTAIPAAEFLPLASLQRALSHAARHAGKALSQYSFPPGDPALRQQIAQRMLAAGCELSPEQILITSGCQEAMTLALRATCKPGAIVAVESPCFYGLLQIIESLGLRALEIPTDPVQGISLSALQLALEQWPVQACALVPSFSNPLGYCLSPSNKQQLVQLLTRLRVPLIENDIYGDLGFQNQRPPACKSFDHQGWVIYCSSFAKTLSPAIRLGWMVAGQYQQQVEYLKYASSLAAPTLAQTAVSQLLGQGGFEAGLRQIRLRYQQQIQRFTQAITEHFPATTKISQPQGGFMLWLELDPQIDALVLQQQALNLGISLAPGPMFSASGKYPNCIRLNCAQSWTSELERALAQLGKMVGEMATPSVLPS